MFLQCIVTAVTAGEHVDGVLSVGGEDPVFLFREDCDEFVDWSEGYCHVMLSKLSGCRFRRRMDVRKSNYFLFWRWLVWMTSGAFWCVFLLLRYPFDEVFRVIVLMRGFSLRYFCSSLKGM